MKKAALNVVPEIERAEPLRIQVARNLHRLLRSGHFPPGTRLTEKRVSDLLGVSRTPAREALGVLGEKGVIEALPQGGYIVPRPTVREIEEAYDVRSYVEVPALKLGFANMSDAVIKDLEDSLGDLESFREDTETAGFVEAVARFRDTLFHACGNERLYQLIQQIDSQAEAVKIFVLSDAQMRGEIIRLYRKMVDAARAADVDAGIALLLEHHQQGRDSFRAFVENAAEADKPVKKARAKA